MHAQATGQGKLSHAKIRHARRQPQKLGKLGFEDLGKMEELR